jgi:hypothetical protein
MSTPNTAFRLPEDELIRIRKVLICYDDLPGRISYREFWEEKDKGGLRQLLQDFYDKAKDFKISDDQKNRLGTSLRKAAVKIGTLEKLGHEGDPTLEEEIMAIYQEIRSILVPFFPDYAHGKDKLGVSKPVVRARKSDIVYEFYEVVDHMFDLRDAMIIYIQQRRYANTLSNYFPDVLRRLEERLNVLIQDVKKYEGIDDKGIEAIHKYCIDRLDILHICFGCKANSYDDKKLQDFFYDILHSFRKDIRNLFNDYLRYILQEESGVSKW